MVPIIVIALLENHIKTVYSLLLVCMATDFLDGLVARHFKQGTKLGAFLDPMADKLLLTSIFMTLTILTVLGTPARRNQSKHNSVLEWKMQNK
jgi:cardiolipin synthase